MPEGTMLQAATVPARALRSAAVGAGFGAASGAGEGESLPDRLSRAATGGAIGGVVGGVASPVMDLAARGVGLPRGRLVAIFSRMSTLAQRGSCKTPPAARNGLILGPTGV